MFDLLSECSHPGKFAVRRGERVFTLRHGISSRYNQLLGVRHPEIHDLTHSVWRGCDLRDEARRGQRQNDGKYSAHSQGDSSLRKRLLTGKVRLNADFKASRSL